MFKVVFLSADKSAISYICLCVKSDKENVHIGTSKQQKQQQ